MSAVYQLTKHINTKMDNGGVTVAIFIDFSKAFNSVQHNRLVSKMEALNLDPEVLLWFADYLNNRKQFTFINDTESSVLDVPYGVPQGSVLGPVLYLLYANDIGEIIQKCNVAMYADDTVIYSKSGNYEEGLVEVQNDLCNLQKWCKENGIYINVTKTKKMVFGSSHMLKKIVPKDILLEGETIEDVPVYTYLGVVMDRQVNFEAHAKKLIDRTAAKLVQMRKMRRFITRQAAIMVYKNMILPVLEYGNIFLSATNLETRKKMQVLQNKALRCALLEDNFSNVSDLHCAARLNKLKHRRDRQVLLFMYPLAQVSENLKKKCVGVRTRSSQKKSMKVKKPNTERFKRSVVYRGPKMWNVLSKDTQFCDSYHQFKSKLDKYYQSHIKNKTEG